MELFLNLASAFVAVLLACLWLRLAPRGQKGCATLGTQLVALALLILIVFPVISVTDDLLAAENPADTDSVQRRDHELFTLSTALRQIACAAVPQAAEMPAATWSRLVAPAPRASLPAAPFLESIENRPPPTA